jgi:hypothetical protein
MRARLARVLTIVIIGGCGGGDSPGSLDRALSRLRGALGGQKTVAADLVGRWIVHRSVRSDSGLRVPSNLRVYAEFGGEPPPNLKPSGDTIVIFPRRVTQSAIIAFGKGGVFRDPSAQVVGDGLYTVLGDSVRITGARGTLVFSIVRSPRQAYSLPGSSTSHVLPADMRLMWSDNDRRQTGLVMMRPK